ncbi:MAG: hypothetical protein WC759_01950 [Candidatus Micrarchaeia archaeon]|jgi:tagatose 1,6-diphosphate aldolase
MDAGVPFTGFLRLSREGQFTILSIDHRSTLKALLNPEKPDSVSARSLAEFKCDVARTISPLASGMILDADSASLCSRPPILSQGCGLMLALEKSGYTEHSGERLTNLSISPAVALKKRADGAKLQLHYNPRFLNSAEKQIALARDVKAHCVSAGIPLLLQVHTYEVPKDLRETAILEAVASFAPHCDMLSTEFPSAKMMQDSAQASCKKLVEAAGSTPWLLSSYGDDFLSFQWKLQAACSGGASGFVAGMALWKDAAGLPRSERDRYLNVVATGRFMQLERVVRRNGKHL